MAKLIIFNEDNFISFKLHIHFQKLLLYQYDDTSFESGWDTSKLTETPTISFDIVYPDSYISSSYISINIIIMITLSIII